MGWQIQIEHASSEEPLNDPWGSSGGCRKVSGVLI
jgi:hypothetical protein